jgi:hypothetical protein
MGSTLFVRVLNWSLTQGLSLYLDGEWEAAQAILEECQAVYPDDGPTKYLLSFMHETGGEAPLDWRGYREAEDI